MKLGHCLFKLGHRSFQHGRPLAMFDEGEVWEQPALLTLAAGLSSAPRALGGRRRGGEGCFSRHHAACKPGWDCSWCTSNLGCRHRGRLQWGPWSSHLTSGAWLLLWPVVLLSFTEGKEKCRYIELQCCGVLIHLPVSTNHAWKTFCCYSSMWEVAPALTPQSGKAFRDTELTSLHLGKKESSLFVCALWKAAVSENQNKKPHSTTTGLLPWADPIFSLSATVPGARAVIERLLLYIKPCDFCLEPWVS